MMSLGTTIKGKKEKVKVKVANNPRSDDDRSVVDIMYISPNFKVLFGE
jgi:hypothetical protein